MNRFAKLSGISTQSRTRGTQKNTRTKKNGVGSVRSIST
jgi:hypothetical protein